jgi:hypothetical protein
MPYPHAIGILPRIDLDWMEAYRSYSRTAYRPVCGLSRYICVATKHGPGNGGTYLENECDAKTVQRIGHVAPNPDERRSSGIMSYVVSKLFWLRNPHPSNGVLTVLH